MRAKAAGALGACLLTAWLPSASLADVPTSPHPQPAEETFHTCPGEGKQGDPDLNLLKNRIDEGGWQPVTVTDILALKAPASVGRKHMAQWPADAHAQVDPFNGVPVQTVGYLWDAKKEGPESPNCRLDDDADVDFHMWLLAHPNDDRRTNSVVVELTPRIRDKHPGWTIQRMHQLAKSHTQIRISGWTMLDPEHPDQVGQSRGTIWEIHPVVLIEVPAGSGGWQELN